MTWPPRWDKPHWKHTGSRKVTRGLKREAAAQQEEAQKRLVRSRDGYCRFPLCNCRRFKLRRDVSHATHKGMGGNPAGDRSVEHLMILLCSARHKDNAIAVDRGTLRIRPLNPKLGLGGPCAFDVDVNRLTQGYAARNQKWLEVGRENARHCFEPFTPRQLEVLEQLKGMEL